VIFRMHRRDLPFTVIWNDILNDDRISFKAKGILVYLLSKPDDWVVRSGHLAGVGPDGRGALRSGMQELEDAGYLRLDRLRSDDGLLEGTQWQVYDNPHNAEIDSVAQEPECGETRLSDNDPLLSTESDQVLTQRVPAPPFAEIMQAWNNLAETAGLASVISIKDGRRKHVRARWRDADWREHWQEALAMIPSRAFLLGENDRGWTADLDWFLKPDSVTRLLEGKYAGKAVKPPAPSRDDGVV